MLCGVRSLRGWALGFCGAAASRFSAATTAAAALGVASSTAEGAGLVARYNARSPSTTRTMMTSAPRPSAAHRPSIGGRRYSGFWRTGVAYRDMLCAGLSDSGSNVFSVVLCGGGSSAGAGAEKRSGSEGSAKWNGDGSDAKSDSGSSRCSGSCSGVGSGSCSCSSIGSGSGADADAGADSGAGVADRGRSFMPTSRLPLYISMNSAIMGFGSSPTASQ